MKQNKIIEKHVLSLWNEGWQVGNIAHIAQVNVTLVRKILKDKGITC